MPQPTCSIRRLKLNAALAERDLPHYALAAGVRIPPTALSAMVNGHRPAPVEVVARIERFLKLEPGSLVEPSSNP